jgi:hypothetical protein
MSDLTAYKSDLATYGLSEKFIPEDDESRCDECLRRNGNCDEGCLLQDAAMEQAAQQKVHWAVKYLKPLRPCVPAFQQALTFDDAQTAWEEWEDSADLYWTLLSTGADKIRMIQSFEEIIRHTFCFLQLRNSPFGKEMEYFLQTVNYYVKKPSAHWAKRCRGAAGRLDSWARTAQPFCRSLILAAVKLEDFISRVNETPCGQRQEDTLKRLFTDAFHIVTECISAMNLSENKVDMTYEHLWQCNTVRRNFPISPFVKDEDIPPEIR